MSDSSNTGLWLLSIARVFLDDDDLERSAIPAIADLRYDAERGRDKLVDRLRVAALILVIVSRRRIERLADTAWLALVPAMLAVALGTWAFREERADRLVGTQLVFLGAGVLVAVLAGSARPRAWAHVGPCLGLAALGLLMAVLAFGHEDHGVRQWLHVGSIRVHVSLLVWPLFIVGFASDVARKSALRALTLAVACFALLVVERDLQPLLVWSASSLVAATLLQTSRRFRAVLVSFAAIGVVACVARPFPLEPVAHVEGVWSLLFARGLAQGGLALACMSIVAATPFVLARRSTEPTTRAITASLGVALVGLFVCPLFLPREPVVLLGYGGSGVVGVFLCLGIALSAARRPTLIQSN